MPTLCLAEFVFKSEGVPVQSKMMMIGRSALALASRSARQSVASTQNYHWTTPSSSLSKYYCVEVSNADRPDATRITVRGPDVDGILASMTVALAQQGCSLKELHAGYAHAETISFEKQMGGDHYLSQTALESRSAQVKCVQLGREIYHPVK